MSDQTVELTVEGVRQRVDLVMEDDARTHGDPEFAHLDQDGIYQDVLRAVANGHPQAREMAVEALRIADNDDRTRWYA